MSHLEVHVLYASTLAQKRQEKRKKKCTVIAAYRSFGVGIIPVEPIMAGET